ncbi:MAG: hypothetical protein ABII76_09260 [Pseudomonadota bacterium]
MLHVIENPLSVFFQIRCFCGMQTAPLPTKEALECCWNSRPAKRLTTAKIKVREPNADLIDEARRRREGQEHKSNVAIETASEDAVAKLT